MVGSYWVEYRLRLKRDLLPCVLVHPNQSRPVVITAVQSVCLAVTVVVATAHKIAFEAILIFALLLMIMIIVLNVVVRPNHQRSNAHEHSDISFSFDELVKARLDFGFQHRTFLEELGLYLRSRGQERFLCSEGVDFV